MTLHMIDSNGGSDMFLIKVEREGSLHGHGVGTLSDVVDRFASVAYDMEAGETADEILVWHLSYGLPSLVTVEPKWHPPIGFVELIFTWDQGNPHTRKITSRTESGYYRISGA